MGISRCVGDGQLIVVVNEDEVWNEVCGGIRGKLSEEENT